LQQVEKVVRQRKARLPPEVFAAAVARSRTRQIDEMVAELVGESV